MKWTEDYSRVKLINLANRFTQIVLVILLALGINLLSQRVYIREDLTRDLEYTLSAETKAYIENLTVPVEIIVTISANSEQEEVQVLYRYVKALLEEFQNTSKKLKGEPLLSLEFVELHSNRNRAAEINRLYGLNEPNVVIFASEGRSRLVRESEFAEFENGQYTSFRGEQVFTSAILEVSSQYRPKVYFTQGHGEMDIRSADPVTGLSQLSQKLIDRNIETIPIDLTLQEQVPDECALLVIANPKGNFLVKERELLRTYLEERSGRMLALLSPGSAGGLEQLVREWGIILDDRVVLEKGDNYVESTGDFLIRHYTETPVTNILLKLQTPLVTGLLRPVRFNPGLVSSNRLSLIPLLASSPDSWGETTWRNAETPEFNENSDLPGPITLAVMANSESTSPLGLEIPGGRLIVIGTGDIFSNRRLQALGNETFMLTLVNWLLERNQMLALPPKPVDRYFIPLSGEEKQKMALAMLLPAGVVFIIGLVILWMRRT